MAISIGRVGQGLFLSSVMRPPIIHAVLLAINLYATESRGVDSGGYKASLGAGASEREKS